MAVVLRTKNTPQAARLIDDLFEGGIDVEAAEVC
jgi:hypothetical protein